MLRRGLLKSMAALATGGGLLAVGKEDRLGAGNPLVSPKDPPRVRRFIECVDGMVQTFSFVTGAQVAPLSFSLRGL
jgi:hypothetical protein